MKSPYSIVTTFFICLCLFQITFTQDTIAQKNPAFIYGDALPDAPELAARGEYQIGVRTIEITNKDQLNIIQAKDGIAPLYDRTLKLEVWYPAQLKEGEIEMVEYEEVMGNANNEKRPLIPFTFPGRAARDAQSLQSEGRFPLIIVSHGYTGSRLMMTYLTENLASKGYVVVAIDHTESTYRDAGPFASTLLNRAKDVHFVLNQMAQLGEEGNDHFLSGLLDANNTGIIGYSMGGYGVLNVGGAGYSPFAVNFFKGATGGNEALAKLSAGNEEYIASFDDRVKAIVALAPWGMARGFWDEEGLKGLKLPTFFIAGSQDDISGYEKGIKAIYEGSVNVDRYLLTYENARHNVAPNPPPAESLQEGLHIDEYYRYAEPSWSNRRINNINQHFISAFLGIHLQQKDYANFLAIPEKSNAGKWHGFKPRTSTGMELLQAKAKQ